MKLPIPKFLQLTTAALTLAFASNSKAQVVFSTNFDGPNLPPEVDPGTAIITGVQGFGGLGPTGFEFGGSFLRSETGNVVTIQLTNLPPHNKVNLSFLFAAIDSLDGTGTFPEGDFFRITLDGVTVFNHSFANALVTQDQTYIPPTGVQLARRVDLGFRGPGTIYTDSAYDLGADPVLANLPHSASTMTIQFVMDGVGAQTLDDESWAIENLTVTVLTNQVSSIVQPAIHLAAEIAWPSVIGAIYQVQVSPSLDAESWTNFGPPITGNGTENSVFDKTRDRDKKFYRVIRLQ